MRQRVSRSQLTIATDSRLQRHNIRLQPSSCKPHPGNRCRQTKPPRARASRIEKQHAIPHLDRRLVGMAEHDG